jgi:peptidoglycan hydrolase CwlO-like protein
MKPYLHSLFFVALIASSSCTRLANRVAYGQKPAPAVSTQAASAPDQVVTLQRPATVPAPSATRSDSQYAELATTVTALQSQIKQLNILSGELEKQNAQYAAKLSNTEKENQALKARNEQLAQTIATQNAAISRLSAAKPTPTADLVPSVTEQPTYTAPTYSTPTRTSRPTVRNRQTSHYYVRGPRGGCYYINGNGNKTYVDRSLCD